MSNEFASYERERLFINNDINIDYSATDNMRTRVISFDKFENTNNLQRNAERNCSNIDDYCLSNKKNNLNIYRYNFIDSIIVELHNFSKIHQFDTREDFKTSWNDWVLENDTIISQETQRLLELGYQGDVPDKMFKSARYYFRKKRTEKKEPAARCDYIGIQKILLDSMDNHIKNNIGNQNFKPSDGFDNFCKENIELLKNEVARLIEFNIKEPKEIKNKIKKTYKNRYFMIINK
jgi:hypothetical protein